MEKVDFENHFATKAWAEALYSNKGYPRLLDDAKTGMPTLWYGHDVSQPFGLLPKLLDLDKGRLEVMDANGVDVAVLSLTAPGAEQFEPGLGHRVAVDSNDVLADAIDRHPDRFVGFAALAPKNTEAAVAELERASPVVSVGLF